MPLTPTSADLSDYKSVFEASPNPIAISRVSDGRIVEANSALANMLGYSREELIGRTNAELQLWQRNDENQQRLMLLRQNGQPLKISNTFRRKSGEMGHAKATLSVITLNGEPHLLGFISDISELQEARQSLVNSERNYRSLFENMFSAFAYCRVIYEDGQPVDFVYLEVNARYEEHTGLKNVVGRRVSEVMPGIREATPGMLELYGRVATTGVPEAFEIHINPIQQWFAGSAFSPEKGHFIATFDRITDRKRLEIEALATKAKLIAALESMSDAVFISDVTGRMVEFNQAFATFHRFKAKEDCSRLLKEYPAFLELCTLGGEPVPMGQWLGPRALRGESATNAEYLLRRKDTGERWYGSFSYAPIRAEDGAIAGFVVVARDITGQMENNAAKAALEAQLRESQKMEAVGTLAGGIAHDFNNMLAAILGNVELAMQDAGTQDPGIMESLSEIRSAASRARELVRQILSFSRKQVAERKPTALAPVIEESVRLLRATLPARLALRAICDIGTPQVLADATQISQVIINLGTNAMQALRGAAGIIDIRLDTVMLDAELVRRHSELAALHKAHPGRTVRLAVSDSGPGMDAATVARIFEPFFTTKPVGEGTGLGLSVVHGIVKGHEGAMVVESQPGCGASFTLYLPEHHSAGAVTSAPTADDNAEALKPAIRPGADRCILYLDDDKALVSLVKRLLERHEMQVSAHSEQSDAFAALRANPAMFDLVVTDYNMPVMSGLDVARTVHDIRADLPVAIVSGFIDETLRTQAEGAGVCEILFKADNTQDFCAAVERLSRKLVADSY